jgi:hypothetical protein
MSRDDLGRDTAPTRAEADRVLATLQPAFGPDEAQATSPTEAEVRRTLANLRARPAPRPWGWILVGTCLAGSALAAGVVSSAWIEPEPVEILSAPAPRPAAPPPAPVAPPTPAPTLAPLPAPSAPPAPPVAPPDTPPEALAVPPAEPPEAPPPASTVPASTFAQLLARLEEGERTPALLAELELYAATQPSTVLAQEATLHALRLRAESSDPVETLARLSRYLDQHGEREDVLELRADVLRGRLGDCGAAVTDYRRLSGATDPRRAARALAWRGLCAVEAGAQRDAQLLLEAALLAGVEAPLKERVELALAALR